MSADALDKLSMCNKGQALIMLGVRTKDTRNEKYKMAVEELTTIERENPFNDTYVYQVGDVLELRSKLMPLAHQGS